MEKILLTHWRSPGDTICMTACVRDLSLTYPNKFEIHIGGTHKEIWDNNPHIEAAWGRNIPADISRARHILLDARRPLDSTDRGKIHYLRAYHNELEQHLNIEIPTQFPKGDLHLSDSEKLDCPVGMPFVLLLPGGKDDMPIKVWPASRFQEVVDNLGEKGVQCVQTGVAGMNHRNPVLSNVRNLVGKTSLREFLQLVHHASVVLCGNSFAMHAASALDKECVVIGGGRESRWWAEYTNADEQKFGAGCARVTTPHDYMHSIGQLGCCADKGCYKTQVSQRGYTNERTCTNIADSSSQHRPVPKCLHRITADEVVRKLLSKLTLTPITGKNK